MAFQIDLTFKDVAQQAQFRAAMAVYRDLHGYMPEAQIIINATIDCLHYEQERDQARAEYNLLMLRHQETIRKLNEATKQLSQYKTQTKRA